MVYVQLGGALVVLLIGGELLVRGAVSIAHGLRIPTVIIGLTVVAFGTSAPEFGVSLKAVLEGSSGIAVGTIIGSNVANVLLVLGLPALFMATGHKTSSVVRDVDMMVGSGVLLLVFAVNGEVVRWQGMVMFALLIGFLYASYRRAREQASGDDGLVEDYESAHPSPHSIPVSLVFVPTGIFFLFFGSQGLVPAAVSIAEAMGVSEKVIGIAMVAVGTSLPELTTSVVAAARKHGDVAIGNVVGSNLFNVLGVLGLTATIAPITVSAEVLSFDIWVMLAVLLLLIPFALRQRTVGRAGGALFLVLYSAFLAAQFTGVPAAVAAGSGWPVW